ncbi:MAG TPA: hypothetical protein DHW15_06815 [Bacteroidetes bacterium]|jgi:uncharacterized membrane protein|nr:MAG: hypothetical protein ABR94_05635 [Sphingobacteriales bacterium BACL12 MAG-120802-bin5]KRP11151.1 MAG: hypothetical protein ABR95_00530 [Sphingobacteriales bacterium BACL12 MAG-120813-bin55]HCK21866.1 hypothetical protein [Bacteroidota bacterium]
MTSIFDKRNFLIYPQAIFYIIAGFSHWIMPEFYLPLIPDLLPEKEIGNALAGMLEVALGVGLLSLHYRKRAATGIILLLLFFVPIHIHFIVNGSCTNSLCVPEWIGWARLVSVHPLLVWWAWEARHLSDEQ